MHRESIGQSGIAAAGLGLGRKLIAYLPALLFLPVVLAPPLNHDVAAILDFSQRWIAGEALYSRLLDANPPLIFVLNLLPASLSKYTGLDAVIAVQLCILLYGTVVWWLTMRLRRRGEEGPIERRFLDVAPFLVLVGAGYDFGQREHLMALGALPYLFLAARRAREQRASHRYTVAVLAAVAFALKPYFIVIPALIELYLLLSRGWRSTMRDPVPWAMAAVWATYLASLPALFSDYLEVVLPLISNNYLGGHSVWEMVLMRRIEIALVLLIPLLWIAFRSRDALATVLGLAAVGAVVSALIQRKGWSYHVVPIELFGCMLAATLAARRVDMHGAGLRKYPQSMASGLSMLFVLYAMSSGEAPWRELGYVRAHEETALTALLNKSAPGARVLVLSPRIWPIYPALNYAHAHQTLRAMNIWVLQGVYRECPPDGRRYRDIEEMDWAERLVFQSVVEDFAADPPKVAVIDVIPGIVWCGKEFDLLEYFKQDPRFAGTWSRYEFFAESDALRLYRRID
jgi:dolichyl-phosphate-mannose-protein mannosyltransferase